MEPSCKVADCPRPVFTPPFCEIHRCCWGACPERGEPTGEMGMRLCPPHLVEYLNIPTHEGTCPGYDEHGRCHCRVPQWCSCGVWCGYDGWDHVHPNGLGIEEPAAHQQNKDVK